MLFSTLSTYFSRIEQVSGRLEMTTILAELFQQLAKEAQAAPAQKILDQAEPSAPLSDLTAAQKELAAQTQSEMEVSCYLMQGSLLASYQSLEFQLSEKMLIRALAKWQILQGGNESSDGNLFAAVDERWQNDVNPVLISLQSQYKALGDMGDLFERVLTQTRPHTAQATKTLTILEVYHQLRTIALTSGVGSQEKKLELLGALLGQLEPVSAKYISRIILGKMRLGFATMTILDALSWAKLGSKDDTATLERAFQKKADLGKLAKSYLIDFAALSAKDLLKKYKVELGVPVVAALCQRLNSSHEIIEKMQTVYAEPKYDGLRMQIHFKRSGFADGSTYRAFTRNLENVTAMFPELAQIGSVLQAENCILDSEAIGVDKQTGKFLAFQDTIQRKRKHDIANKAAEVPIRFFVFDVLYLDDRQLIDEPLEERKTQLAAVLTDSPLAEKTKFLITSDADELKAFHERQLALGLEGAVIKKAGSAYVSGRKGWRWVKIKEEEGSRGKLSDTLDCVMMGYYFGKGKRQEFGIGALLVGITDRDENDQIIVKSISKIGTGLTDEQFRQVKQLADALLTKENRKPFEYEVDKSLYPDRWLEPQLVLEIAADEITQSPIHAAGVALRFPRLVKIRNDKSLAEATTMTEIKEIKIA